MTVGHEGGGNDSRMIHGQGGNVVSILENFSFHPLW